MNKHNVLPHGSAFFHVHLSSSYKKEEAIMTIPAPKTICINWKKVTHIINHLGLRHPRRVAAYQVYMMECTHRFIPAKKQNDKVKNLRYETTKWSKNAADHPDCFLTGPFGAGGTLTK